MSQENVEIVRSFYRAWARDEIPGPVELMDPEIEYVNPAGAVEPGTRRGLAAFSNAVEKVYEGWESWQMELEKVTAEGDQVVVVVSYRARGRGSGVEVEGRESALWNSPRRQGLALRLVSSTGGSPRSRRASGVGDVAGERGDCAGGRTRGFAATSRRSSAPTSTRVWSTTSRTFGSGRTTPTGGSTACVVASPSGSVSGSAGKQAWTIFWSLPTVGSWS